MCVLKEARRFSLSNSAGFVSHPYGTVIRVSVCYWAWAAARGNVVGAHDLDT